MNENVETVTDAGADGPGANSLDFESRVGHLRAGYENSQAAVRFLDTKAAAVVGGIPVILGIFTTVFKWALDAELGASIFSCVVGLVISVIFSLTMLLLAWLSLHSAFQALSPRNTGEAQPSVLFPYRSSGFGQRLSFFTDGKASEETVVEDYHRQITRMSEIVEAKMDRVKSAIRYLQCLLCVGISAVAVLALVAAFG
ncbi:MAG: hypothetical protein CL958_03045 [Euryarchaeota archaeon]|nr:hypothetical protein [Marinobacter sp.]